MIQIPIDNPFGRFESRIIGLPEILESTAFIPLVEKATLNDEGWDDLSIDYTTKRPTLTAEQLAAAFPLGTRLGSRNWWVVGSTPECIASGVWKAEVRFKGWAQTKPNKISVGAAADEQSAENVTTREGLFAKVAVTENTPTMRVSYLVANYTTAPTNEVGRAKIPPDAVAVAASIWDTIGDFTYHYPNGWVLMSSEPDRLVGSTAALVTDTYKYIRSISI